MNETTAGAMAEAERLLDDAWRARSEEMLDRFFEHWAATVLPTDPASLVGREEWLRDAYSLIQAFYAPRSDEFAVAWPDTDYFVVRPPTWIEVLRGSVDLTFCSPGATAVPSLPECIGLPFGPEDVVARYRLSGLMPAVSAPRATVLYLTPQYRLLVNRLGYTGPVARWEFVSSRMGICSNLEATLPAVVELLFVEGREQAAVGWYHDCSAVSYTVFERSGGTWTPVRVTFGWMH